VTAKRPVQTAPDTVQIHGTAQDAAGNPLPIAELEQRLVAPGDLFLANGRRTLRATSAAGLDGTLSYDAPGSVNWTATYKNLLPADVDRALGADSRGMWIDPRRRAPRPSRSSRRRPAASSSRRASPVA
jgi:hypothetical protein